MQFIYKLLCITNDLKDFTFGVEYEMENRHVRKNKKRPDVFIRDDNKKVKCYTNSMLNNFMDKNKYKSRLILGRLKKNRLF